MAVPRIALCAIAVCGAQVMQVDRGNMVHKNFESWPDVRKAWSEFKDLYRKSYEGVKHDLQSMHIWLDNLAHIQDHNVMYTNGLAQYKLEMTEFGDETRTFFSVRNGYMGANKRGNKNGINRRPQHQMSGMSFMGTMLPTSVDWRKHGFVTPVKNQGQCGSCWSFSTTGALEGQMMRLTGKLPSLSEQNLMDCSKAEGNNGCNGGLMDNAFDYIHTQNGIDSEKSYPYEMRDDRPCRYHAEDRAGDDVGFMDIPEGSEEHLKDALAHVGPVSVAIDAGHRSFRFYSEGIYYDEACSSSQLDHGVLAVGYGDACEDEGDWARRACQEGHSLYWIVKNSWGPEWGDAGFIKMARGRNNHCGIATAASYPLVSKAMDREEGFCVNTSWTLWKYANGHAPFTCEIV